VKPWRSIPEVNTNYTIQERWPCVPPFGDSVAANVLGLTKSYPCVQRAFCVHFFRSKGHAAWDLHQYSHTQRVISSLLNVYRRVAIICESEFCLHCVLLTYVYCDFRTVIARGVFVSRKLNSNFNDEATENSGTNDPVPSLLNKGERNDSTRIFSIASHVNAAPKAVSVCQAGWHQ